ncbi:MAG TPA: exodeoxyribonuclease VII small subunit [Syntrophales bacterium]|nr:exodeoxyribonuclease VII small subunit [Syntrophales bacterium]HOL60178.1 exodeoxyribonuclease VII small subunit [Syntrophales bacterium]HPO36355.1 exodeoxyribonuclease VII small subunit [Syntrophales bacterium]
MAKDKFEDAIKRLEEIVETMERGDLTLEESLKAFEEGVKLVRICTKKLEEAERKVEMLIKNEEGALTLTPFPEEKVGRDE